MEKVLMSVMRQRLIDKYVPKEPPDPLVYKMAAFYWLMHELIGNWKSGRRLTLDQKAQLVQLLVWNLSRVQQEQAAYDEYEAEVMIPGIEAFTEDKIRRQGLDYPRETIPHAVDDDINISDETTEQIAQLVLACKELGKSQACEVD